MPDSLAPHDPPRLPAGATQAAPTWRAAYSDRTASLMAAFSQMAYLPFEQAPAAGPRQPKPERPGGREALQACLGPDFTAVEIFNRDDTQAFLAISADFAVLAFRGTANFQDWVTNLDAVLVPLPDTPEVWVHKGFLSAFSCCKADIERAIDAHVGPDLGLYITGHSLGGALAQIASAVLERDNLAACYTFGSPRVGTLDFDVQVKCPHYRVVNDWDLVPGVPPPWRRGYQHSGDPRLLEPAATLLRRDRSPVSRFLVDVAASLVAVVSKRFLALDDHMIWNYRAKLDAIAAARASAAGAAGGTQGAGVNAAASRASRVKVLNARQDWRPILIAVLGGLVLLGLRRRRGRPG